MGSQSRLQEFLSKVEVELDNAVDFWLKYSHDDENGGFFTCLGKDGQVYDETKYCWLQGRQVWMYCKLYNTVPKYHTDQVLKAAIKGGEFLMKHVKDQNSAKCFFSVTKDGQPIKVQRTIFSECFYLLAMSELGRATKEQKYKGEAVKMLDKVEYWARVDNSELGRPELSGSPPTNALAIAMIFFNLVDEVCWDDVELQKKYSSLLEWSVEQTLQHLQREGSVVLEFVGTDGKELRGSQGRLINPGHAIETGWFLLQHAVKTQNEKLKETAIRDFILKPFNHGWDDKYGGIFCFLDANGLSPTQLEWNMKLWWPHNEALIAFLMAFKETRDAQYLSAFEKVFDYSMEHFTDGSNGEWFGYLDREGHTSMDFKGGPFKGCFHVPRCLMMCAEMLKELISE
ncbi:N-acylglucosamine 2-epimerase-like isoform X2 [Anneissia japonica]|uniref:N-acylglucosamine 2-epimerase-like isoform X2 n=1 Tax=Anneissia japonica TaxID=1529436 RepID=UPI0014258C28|nr:N-acylglucosamine 2-epimerase-like isoform X2 [Anneissia japonica]XP_033115462.1 N-acylglucosamine 2-epimerase-like isoform X2 [Anneissia japonica]XP_033115463.1 N-acylglucosamine 2-epimerase-like isoform X2 [Anneissia japonica]XP_033115464.1 N-acylglucosamine 2-epimerase-like isoform X2 [Anneissia japonica]